MFGLPIIIEINFEGWTVRGLIIETGIVHFYIPENKKH